MVEVLFGLADGSVDCAAEFFDVLYASVVVIVVVSALIAAIQAELFGADDA